MNDDSDAAEIRVVCGPTGAGKSAIALWLAERVATGPCTILSADSRQVYRRFDVGTAKPTREARTRLPHMGIDVADPAERYSAARWAADARAWIGDAARDGRTPLVVGGTGLYLRALFGGLFVEPVLDPVARTAWSGYLERRSMAELRRWVAVIDPDRAHLGRTQLLRAIEIAMMTGTRISRLHAERATIAPWRPRYLVIDPGPALAAANADRVDTMLAGGWLDEVRSLMRDVPGDAPAWNATGYGIMRRLASEDLDLSSAREAIVIETRQYAKRQRTWFRHQLDPRAVTRLDPSAPGWERQADAWWRAAELRTA